MCRLLCSVSCVAYSLTSNIFPEPLLTTLRTLLTVSRTREHYELVRSSRGTGLVKCVTKPHLFGRTEETNTHGILTSVASHLEKKTPWSESASELYRSSDRRLSAK
jgi:hypothetical protein